MRKGTYLYAAFAEEPFYAAGFSCAQPAASTASGFVQTIALLIGMAF